MTKSPAFKGYNGSTLLKKSNVPIQWTPELMAEYIHCKNDVFYFIKNYVKIVHVDLGLIDMELYDYQHEMVEKMRDNRETIILTARQIGKTSAVVAFLLWYILFDNENDQNNADVRITKKGAKNKKFGKRVGILANKGETAQEILSRLQLAYENLPKWLQHGVSSWNKRSFSLENGSKVIAAATSSNNVRGWSFNLIFIDEAAAIENWEKFSRSVLPTISSGKTTKLVFVSTPNGLNHFFKMWNDSLQGANNYARVKVLWNRVPHYDEAWKAKEIALHGQEGFDQEYGCEFIGSSGTLISGWKLKELSMVQPLFARDGVSQYEKPIKNHAYVIVADVAEGKLLDYSAFQIVDITKRPFKQVATYRSNQITPIEFADVINQMGKHYNYAHALVELNSVGAQTCEELYNTLGYENMVWTQAAKDSGKQSGQGFGDKPSVLGIRTTKRVKAMGCSMMKMLIEQNQLIVYDAHTIFELNRFSRNGTSYEAEEGCTDDLVMALVLFGWFVDQPFFRELSDIDVLTKLKDHSEKEIMDSLTPFGVMGQNGSKENRTRELLGKNNKEGWVLDNPAPKTRIYF